MAPPVASAEQVRRLAVQSRNIRGIERILQRLGGELLIAEYVHGVRKVWAADRMVTVTVAGRFLHAQQEQGGAFQSLGFPRGSGFERASSGLRHHRQGGLDRETRRSQRTTLGLRLPIVMPDEQMRSTAEL